MGRLVVLERCEICKSAGRIRGVFHMLECAGCNGGGFVRPDGTALTYPQLVEQLRLRLARSGQERQRLQKALEAAGMWPLSGPANDYRGNNKKGAGGAHFAGD